MRKLEVKVGDLTVEGVYERPAFTLLHPDTQGYTAALYARLERFGTTANNISYGTVGSLADRHVLVNAPRVAAGVKLSVSKLEIGFNDLMRVTLPDVNAIAMGAFDALSETDSKIKFGGFVTIMNVHGTIEGATARTFLAPYFSKVPKGLGDLSGSAAGFYYGPKEARHYVQIVLDTSALVSDGLFMRISAAFDGQKIAYKQVFGVARDTFKDAFASMELKPDLDLGSGK